MTPIAQALPDAPPPPRTNARPLMTSTLSNPKGVNALSDERPVEFNGVFDDDQAVFGVLEADDENSANETEDEDVRFHDGFVKKYSIAYTSENHSASSNNNGLDSSCRTAFCEAYPRGRRSSAHGVNYYPVASIEHGAPFKLPSNSS